MGYRRNFEAKLAAQMAQAGVAYGYESSTVRYTKPESAHRYTPDFILPNGIIIESKGRLTLEDRIKHLLIRQQHPSLDIRFVFMRSSEPIRKGAATTYADWCRRHGFEFADRVIPPAWIALSRTWTVEDDARVNIR